MGRLRSRDSTLAEVLPRATGQPQPGSSYRPGPEPYDYGSGMGTERTSAGPPNVSPEFIFQVIDEWQNMVDHPAPEVEPGSDLAFDTARSGTYDVGHAAWSGIAVAIDHLHALRELIVKAGSLHTYAPFSLIRSAMDNASLALWLIGPDDSDERVLRCLRVASENVRQSRDARAVLGPRAPQPPRPDDVRLQEITDIANALGINSRGAAGARWAGYERIVEEAATLTRILDPGATAFLWRACSAFGHGRQWAALALLNRELQPRSQGVLDVRLTTTVEQVALYAGTAVVINQQAIRTYHARRLAQQDEGRASGSASA